MILRSQLRMNKNIVFPFISCLMIMLTLLVLIHKSADQLNAAKKEISLCKQQHDSVYSQLQNAIAYKLRLEKSLEDEKANENLKIEEVKRLLNQEKEERQKEREELRKEKEEGNTRYETLKQQFDNVQNDNNELKSDNEETRKKLQEVEEENRKLTAQLQQLQTSNNKIIEDLREKLKAQENQPQVGKKATSEVNPAPPMPERVDLVQSSSKGSTTPQINPDAIKGHEDSPKQVAPPPNNDDSGNMIKKLMLGYANDGRPKPDENVIKSPLAKPDEEKEHDKAENVISPNEVKKSDSFLVENSDNKNQQHFIPLPPLPYQRQPSSASNNAERGNRPQDQAGVLPPPAQPAPSDENKEKENDSQNMIKEDVREEYGKDINEEEGGDEDYEKDNANIKREQGAG